VVEGGEGGQIDAPAGEFGIGAADLDVAMLRAARAKSELVVSHAIDSESLGQKPALRDLRMRPAPLQVAFLAEVDLDG